MNFHNQTILITGGTRGIGLSLVETYLEKGAQVIATYKSNQQAVDNCYLKFEKYKDKLHIFQCDSSKKEDIENLTLILQERFPRIEVLINNSGIRRDQILALMSEEDWDCVIDTNLKGTFLMCKALLPFFLSQKYGRILNISSLSAQIGLKGQANYAASKAGQCALTKSLAKEVARKGITVNSLLPGFIETEMTESLPDQVVKDFKTQIPMRRFGTTKEVANAACFLTSKEASYITGSELIIAGGLH